MDTFGIAEQHGGFFVRQMHLSGGHTARCFKTREEADAELSLREMYPDTATFAKQPEHSGYVGHGSGNK